MKTLTIATAVATALTLSACGGSDSPAPSPTPNVDKVTSVELTGCDTIDKIEVGQTVKCLTRVHYESGKTILDTSPKWNVSNTNVLESLGKGDIKGIGAGAANISIHFSSGHSLDKLFTVVDKQPEPEPVENEFAITINHNASPEFHGGNVEYVDSKGSVYAVKQPAKRGEKATLEKDGEVIAESKADGRMLAIAVNNAGDRVLYVEEQKSGEFHQPRVVEIQDGSPVTMGTISTNMFGGAWYEGDFGIVTSQSSYSTISRDGMKKFRPANSITSLSKVDEKMVAYSYTGGFASFDEENREEVDVSEGLPVSAELINYYIRGRDGVIAFNINGGNAWVMDAQTMSWSIRPDFGRVSRVGDQYYSVMISKEHDGYYSVYAFDINTLTLSEKPLANFPYHDYQDISHNPYFDVHSASNGLYVLKKTGSNGRVSQWLKLDPK